MASGRIWQSQKSTLVRDTAYKQLLIEAVSDGRLTPRGARVRWNQYVEQVLREKVYPV